MHRVSILGYGRFGAALSDLLRDAGLAVRALDPHAPVPEALRARTLADLADGAELVIVAVPVPHMESAFASLRPLLSPAQIVIDVGSVKVEPARLMAKTFDRTIPWVATHPLFGPTSLALGERPLRVVVCPNPLHPEAVRRTTALFERIGCQVIEQDPEAHDRAMAFTHALAFFVAKGLLDAGAPSQAPYAPPSFQAIARTIESVRSDAGHLFEALHRENPYAREARHRLLDALTDIDHRLEQAASAPKGASPSLAIPNLGAQSPELRETRELIDDLDRQLITLLAQRAQLSRRAARAKAELGRGVYDPQREALLVAARRLTAVELGLDPDSISEIFEAILRFSRRVQEPPSREEPS